MHTNVYRAMYILIYGNGIAIDEKLQIFIRINQNQMMMMIAIMHDDDDDDDKFTFNLNSNKITVYISVGITQYHHIVVPFLIV